MRVGVNAYESGTVYQIVPGRVALGFFEDDPGETQVSVDALGRLEW